ncbi:MAG TPA: porin family protein [Xanthomonadaceae bacterium]|jgi:opacity protein-like surface antigen
MNKTILVASLLALAGMSSVAAAADDNWFIRGELGSGKLHVNDLGSTDSDTAGQIAGGYYFNPNFAVEGFYENYGKHGDGVGDSVEMDGWGLGVVAKKDFGPNNTGFFIDGRLGLAFNNMKFTAAGLGSASDNSTKAYFGVGLGYDFNRNFGLSLNYDYTSASAFGVSGHANTWTGGLEVRF